MIDKLPVWECATQTFQLPHPMLAKQFINNSQILNPRCRANYSDTELNIMTKKDIPGQTKKRLSAQGFLLRELDKKHRFEPRIFLLRADCANHLATAAACTNVSKIRKTDGLFPRTPTSPPAVCLFTHARVHGQTEVEHIYLAFDTTRSHNVPSWQVDLCDGGWSSRHICANSC